MKYVYHYPEGHENEGVILFVFNDYSVGEPPRQTAPDGTELELYEADDTEVPGPTDLDLSAIAVDTSVPEIVSQ